MGMVKKAPSDTGNKMEQYKGVSSIEVGGGHQSVSIKRYQHGLIA